MKKKTVCIVCPNLAGGGVERMVLHLLLHLNRQKYKLLFVLFEKKGVYLDQVPKDVKILCLHKKHKFSQFKIVMSLAFHVFYKIKPDIVMSFMLVPNILTLLSRCFAWHRPRVIISIRNNPDRDLQTQKMKGFKKGLMKLLYPRADGITVISRGIKESLVQNYGFKAENITVVHNGVHIKQVTTLAAERPRDDLFIHTDVHYITACGRLTLQKGFSYLIQAFRGISDATNALLYIFGEGEERERLTGLIHRLDMTQRIFLPGFIPNPFPYIAGSDLFILSSLYEGFGNVVVEAMACNTPVIATDCPYGPGEIIEHGISGILVPPGDVEKMSAAILRVMGNKELRRSLAVEGKKRVEDFSLERMVGGYEGVCGKLSPL